MQEANLFEVYLNKLNSLDIPYFVTGSVASIVYGEPRLTNDIDIVLHLTKDSIAKILEAFPLEAFYCPPYEVLMGEVVRKTRGHFNLIHHKTGFKADIYLIGEDSLQRWALNNRKFIEYSGKQIPIAPPEYVILKKLEYYKEGGSTKHVDDIKGIIEHSSELIDFNFLIEKAKEKNLDSILDEILKIK